MKWGVVFLVLLVFLAGCTGIDFQDLVDQNPGALVTINKLENDNAELFLTSLESFCPEIYEKEIYRVQIVTNKTITQALNKKGNVLCEVDTSDPDFLEKSVANQLKVQILINQIIQDADPTVIEDDAKAYYENNKESLMLSESWTIRHIQISFSERGDQADFAKAQTVYNLLESTDFCDLVTQFSDDTSSLDKCGRYTFTSGQMQPEVEKDVKDMTAGEVRVSKSQAAYHIVELESINPARQATYFEVKDQIRNFLLLQKRQEVLNEYINGLRQEANIVSYLS